MDQLTPLEAPREGRRRRRRGGVDRRRVELQGDSDEYAAESAVPVRKEKKKEILADSTLFHAQVPFCV